MRLYLTMPKPGETIREGRVVRWLKAPGDSLEEQEPLVELETEKAVFTYESPFHGTLKEILVAEGKQIAVGGRLACFEVSEEDGNRYRLLGVGLPAESSGETGSRPAEGPPQGVAPPMLQKGGETSSPQYSPLIRNLAKEHGLSLAELDQIPRTGPRLTKEDVLAYLKSRSSAQGGRETKGDFEKIPLSPIRRRIAQKMQESKREIPHAASSVDVDFTDIWNYCSAQTEAFSRKIGVEPTPFFFFLYAVREVLKKFPLFNSHFVEEAGEASVYQYKSLHLGVAVATPQGLLNPVLHRAETMGFRELTQAASELGKKAREGKLSVEELTGATFAVNNPGALGGVRCYQIIPAPRVAIVGLNRIQKRPWVVGDKIVPRSIAAVDLSFDHRVLDGADAIRFLETLKTILEKFPFEVIEK
jgi:pyruvate/2-oxoglutarate dehydrogenase complex dihydrolipoamide acyltransferase (E2) component